jgi:hypothetical protein
MWVLLHIILGAMHTFSPFPVSVFNDIPRNEQGAAEMAHMLHVNNNQALRQNTLAANSKTMITTDRTHTA